MKKLYTLLFVALTSISFGQQAIPFGDSFSYAAGNLHETAPWAALGTPSTTGDHIVLDGAKVTFAGGGTDAQLSLVSQTSGTIFYKFDLNVTSMAGVTDANGGYLAGFSQNTTTFGGTLWTKRVDDNTFNIGIETRTATAANTTFTTDTYTTGTTYTVLVAYTFNTGTTSDDAVQLWVNPVVGGEATPLLSDTHTGTDLTAIASFFYRQDSATETPSVEIDNLKITTSYSEALANASFSAIPGLRIYPNPVSNGTLFIETAANAERTVAIFDVLGKQVLNTKTSENAINLSNLRTGVYVVKITEEGKTTARKLVIK